MREISGFVALTSLLFVQALSPPAQAVSKNREDCVGRYQLTLPEDVDVAVSVPVSLERFIDNSIQFDDGRLAVHSRFIYNGVFAITSEVDGDYFVSYKKAIFKNGIPGTTAGPRMLELQLDGASGWSERNSAGFAVYRLHRIFDYSYSEYRSGADAKIVAKNTASGFAARNEYGIPKGNGVCLPFSFVSDDGTDRLRQVGVTYRLKSHPDVTVFFLDAKALSSDPKLTSRQKNEFVWSDEYGIGKRVRLHGLMPYRSIKIDGREGVASFATITRDDGSTDYGYLATAQGDPDAPVDTPNLLLLVERNARYARGIPSVSAEELGRIAEGIAASVKRRSIQ